MSDTTPEPNRAAGGLDETKNAQMSALFAGMVLNQTQMTLMLLGHVPHPQTGEQTVDLDNARLLIDQLEMIDHKTRGNLEEHESRMLRDSLTALRMAFVEAANTRAGPAAPAKTQPPIPSAPPQTPKPDGHSPVDDDPAPTSSAAPDAESRKKFTKKY